MKICKLHNFKRQCTARLDDESTGFLSTNGKVYMMIKQYKHQTLNDLVCGIGACICV